MSDDRIHRIAVIGAGLMGHGIALELAAHGYGVSLHDRDQAALERVAQAYEGICEEVKKAENKYEAAATLLGSERPFGQVRLLWQIFGLQEAAG